MAFIVDGEARVAFTNIPGQAPDTPDNGELKVQQADALLVSRRADGRMRLTDIRPMTEQLASGPLADAIGSAARRGHTPVSDTDYQCRATDVQVGMIALSAPRTIFLPDVDTFPLGQDLVIADESGACSDTRTITIRPGPGTDDLLGVDGGALQLFDAYQAVRLRRGASNLWIRL